MAGAYELESSKRHNRPSKYKMLNAAGYCPSTLMPLLVPGKTIIYLILLINYFFECLSRTFGVGPRQPTIITAKEAQNRP